MSKKATFCLLAVGSVCVLAGMAGFDAGIQKTGAPLAAPNAGILSGPPETHEFATDATISVGSPIEALIAGDLRNDGVNRLVIGMSGTHYAYVYGKPGASYVEEWNNLYAGGDDVIPVAVGDVDNDGLNEFLISVYGTGNIYMYRWNGATYQKVHEQYFGGNYMPAAIFDIDRDGANELIVDGSGAGALISVFDYDSASENFYWPGPLPRGTPFRSPSGDPDNDGQREAVVPLPWDYPPGKMMIIGYSGSAYAVEETISSFSSGLGGAAVADFDGDGKEEIITGLFNVVSTAFPVYLVKHDGAQYNVTTLYNAGHGTFLVQAGDIDRDGLPEAVITVNGPSAEVIEWQGHATFGPGRSHRRLESRPGGAWTVTAVPKSCLPRQRFRWSAIPGGVLSSAPTSSAPQARRSSATSRPRTSVTGTTRIGSS